MKAAVNQVSGSNWQLMETQEMEEPIKGYIKIQQSRMLDILQNKQKIKTLLFPTSKWQEKGKG